MKTQDFLIGQLLSRTVLNSKYKNIQDAEFKVFSQWGDDGIIQYLVNNINIEKEKFIEFGVENYLESNTRFLLMNNNWSGLIIDGNKRNIEYIKNDEIYWKYDLIAKYSFVTAENINELLIENDFVGSIGLLHIDIDGNDYWIWKAINVVEADIVIVEYNSLFGFEKAITIPYEPYFNRTKKHYSNLYAGTSLLALCDLAEKKGYFFVGTNKAGNNAYFVKKNKIGNLKPLSAEEGFTLSKFRESRDKKGKLTFLRGSERLNIIKGLNVYNTRTNKIEKL